MSSAPAPPPAAPQPPTEIKLYSHSTLFYWWPVWLLGLILGGLTMLSGEYMVIIPPGGEARRQFQVQTPEGKLEPREGVLLKPVPFDKDHLRKHLPPNADEDDLRKDPELRLHSTSRKAYGGIFATVLLLVIFITNVPLRGMWSVLIIVMIIMLSVIFALAGLWDKILTTVKALDIRLSAGGYFFIALGLLGLWFFAFFFFDRQVYITFVPGAFKVSLEIGAGEKQYDTMGMTIEKERSDLFRHWILGLGSGDLIVRTSGADRHEFRLNNVLFINHKLKMIEEMQRVRQGRPTRSSGVTSSRAPVPASP